MHGMGAYQPTYTPLVTPLTMVVILYYDIIMLGNPSTYYRACQEPSSPGKKINNNQAMYNTIHLQLLARHKF